jgi:hypothetical protein
MPTDQPVDVLTCTRCDVVLELCAFCEREDCPDAICLRCLCTQLEQRTEEQRWTSA